MKKKNRRILIIDDRSEIRGCIRLLLENEGFDVLFATCGDSGVLQAKAGLPNLILISSVLKLGDASDVFNEIKKSWSTSHIPIAFLPDLSCFSGVNPSDEDEFETSLVDAPLPVGELYGEIHGAMRIHGSLHV